MTHTNDDTKIFYRRYNSIDFLTLLIIVLSYQIKNHQNINFATRPFLHYTKVLIIIYGLGAILDIISLLFTM